MQTVSIIIYNISIRLYAWSICIASLLKPKAKRWIEGRKDEPDYISLGSTGNRIWFHCASLGEFEQARPVIEQIKRNIPDAKIILTFFSPSGFEIRKNYELADMVCYLPLDTASNAKQFIEHIKPGVVLFVKYEFWYHFLNQLKSQNIPVILFSSVFRKNQIFFKWYGGLFRAMLKMFDKIFVQNSESKELLQSISVSSEVAFDTRFDRVYQIAQYPEIFHAVTKFKENSKVFIAGSTWNADDELILRLFNEGLLGGFKLIIASHDLGEAKINNLINSIKGSAKRLSELTEDNAKSTDVIIVDSIGNLASLYAYGDIAYVGGGFNASVHNVLEPAAYGMPVIFGPNHSKSIEAMELISTGVAFTVSGFEDLTKTVTLLNEKSSAQIAELSRKYVETRTGGTGIIYKYLSKFA